MDRWQDSLDDSSRTITNALNGTTNGMAEKQQLKDTHSCGLLIILGQARVSMCVSIFLLLNMRLVVHFQAKRLCTM